MQHMPWVVIVILVILVSRKRDRTLYDEHAPAPMTASKYDKSFTIVIPSGQNELQWIQCQMLKINENSTIDVIRSQRADYDCISRVIFAPQTISFAMFDVATNFNIGSKNCMLVLVAAAGAY